MQRLRGIRRMPSSGSRRIERTTAITPRKGGMKMKAMMNLRVWKSWKAKTMKMTVIDVVK